MPVVVADAGPLIHLAQIGKLHLLKKLFQNVFVTARVKVGAFDEGVRLGCADAETIGKALSEGWLTVEPVPERLAKLAVKLAEGENISRADAETLLLAKEKKAVLLQYLEGKDDPRIAPAVGLLVRAAAPWIETERTR